MIGFIDDDTTYQWWLDFFTLRDHDARIKYIADNYPEIRSLELSYPDIFSSNGDLAEMILDQPERAIRIGETAIQSMLEPDQRVEINLRIKDLFKAQKIGIRHLRAEQLSRFVLIEGIVRKVTEVRPKLLVGSFSCTACGQEQEIIQDSFHFTEPLECTKDDGGCGKRAGSTTFKFQINESLFIDSQKIEIQEYPEGLRGGDQPQRISIFVEEDLCGKVSPGDRISITGILKAKQRKEGQVKATTFDLYQKGNCIEKNDQVYEEMDLTEEDINRAKILSKDPEIFKKLIKSIAPSIFGLEKIKEALALQLFGGVAKEYPDGSKGRGDIHLLLVGDPGTAKSHLLVYMSELAPRGIFTSGKSSSAAGLTAAVVKDDFGEGRYTLEAGVMVLADKGLACIDEMDKMGEQDRAAMHEAMEQQTVSIAKAGIQASLQSRCSVLGAANPKHGRFRINTPYHDQINLPPPLRSRFDLIFTLTDVPDPDSDRDLANSVVKRHWLGELKSLERIGDRTLQHMVETGDRDLEETTPVINPNELRKYAAYSKRVCFPLLSKEAKNKIVDFYVDIRERSSMAGGEGQGSIALTARQLEALVRLSEASARMRLRDKVTRQDVKIAIEIMEYSLNQIAKDEFGVYDIDGVIGSGSRSQINKMSEIIQWIKELQLAEGKATRKELVKLAQDVNIDELELDNFVKKLKEEGAIYEPRSGEYSILK